MNLELQMPFTVRVFLVVSSKSGHLEMLGEDEPFH